jgi:uncharacterized membrane protein SpoIIM required for sporulation
VLRKVVAYGLATAAFLALVRFETDVFTSNASAVLRSGPWMATLIFAHNSLAATAVAAGMSFCTALIDALPEKFKRREVLVKEHARLFSAAFAVFIVLNSLFVGGGLSAFNFQLIHLWLPVAAVEACGLYLATLYPLQRRVSAVNMAKVYFIFLVGAFVETIIILA